MGDDRDVWHRTLLQLVEHLAQLSLGFVGELVSAENEIEQELCRSGGQCPELRAEGLADLLLGQPRNRGLPCPACCVRLVQHVTLAAALHHYGADMAVRTRQNSNLVGRFLGSEYDDQRRQRP